MHSADNISGLILTCDSTSAHKHFGDQSRESSRAYVLSWCASHPRFKDTHATGESAHMVVAMFNQSQRSSACASRIK